MRERAKELRKAGFLHEVVFWEKLKGKQICGLDFHRQQIIGNFIVDFFAPQIGLVIELDGCSHDERKDYDKEREDYLKSLGLKIIRFSSRETLHELKSVIKKLKNFIEKEFQKKKFPERKFPERKFPSPRGVAAAKAADGVYRPDAKK